jgi:predicted TIM-barrel fold metal-dependent hydrolase
MRIIDAHTHIFSPKTKIGRSDYFEDFSFRNLYENPKSRIADGDDLLLAMDEDSIEASFVMGFPWENREFCDEQNDYILSVTEKNKGRVYPFGTVSLGSEDPYRDAKILLSRGFSGIGELAFYKNGFSDKDKEYLNGIFTACGETQSPVFLHVNEPVGHGYAGKYATDFKVLTEIIARFPETKIVLSHWGGGLFVYELMPEIRKSFSNVYYDTAATPYLYNEKIYDAAIQCTSSDKTIYGSDYPLLRIGRYLRDIDNLGVKEKEDILAMNAIRLLSK